MVNLRAISKIIGVIILIFTLFMVIPMAWSLFKNESVYKDFLYAIAVLSSIGLLAFFIGYDTEKIAKRDGFLSVTLSWVTLCFAGALPYFFSGSVDGFINALFESTSGLTTTGASILTDIESSPEGILLWRSLTQWIGGMGIIVLTVAIMPLLGISGIELFVAEAPGPKSEKIHPKIKETAKRLWLIYFGLTVILCLHLYGICKMSFFDALNHALTTMSTGGFSTKNTSMEHFGPLVQYSIMFFMFLAGMNYTIIYFGIIGKFKKVWSSDEFKYYFLGSIMLIILVGMVLHFNDGNDWEESFRDGAFQIISLITTTGFVSADYTSWNTGLTAFFFILLFAGACAGSTSGGIKVIRHLVFARNARLEFKRLLHPRAMIRVKIDGQVVPPKILTHILVFLLLYLTLLVISIIPMSIILQDVEQPLLTAIGSVATSLGNVGPGIGQVGPIHNFNFIPDSGKLLLSALMVIGRLELFTVLIIFSPSFWRLN